MGVRLRVMMVIKMQSIDPVQGKSLGLSAEMFLILVAIHTPKEWKEPMRCYVKRAGLV